MVYQRRKQQRNKRRGWYAEAKIGKGVPFLGGTGFRFGKRALMAKVARREIMKNEETKVYPTTAINSGLLTHNTVYTIAPTQQIAVGTAENERVGQTIYVRHIKVKGYVQNTSIIANAAYRIMAVWSDEKYNTPWTAFNSGLGSTQLFYGGNMLLSSLVNNKLGNKVICDKVVRVQAGALGDIVSKTFEFDCPIFERLTFEYGAAVPYLFNKKNLYVIVIPFAPNGTTGVTQPGKIEIQAITTYKDA